ncbi:hypothetical protein ACO2Q8_19960 [Larkinella sp. VNQ87]|uniref:hypothetical protein n=1 Tax=Larkinella sp. VNQ87 TaxID=3400921 RepID=UPI003C07A4DC
MKKFVLALATILAVVSCKDQDDVKPENLGTFLIYTSLNGAKFDQIEIKLDGKTVGTLSQPYLLTLSPPCDTKASSSVFSISRPEGSYSFDAIATLKGKEVTKWSTALRFEVGECNRRRLTSDL